MADVSKIGANGIEYDVCDTAARLGVQTANTNIASLREDLTADETDIANLQSDMTTAQGNITTLQNTDANLQTQINALKSTSASGYCKMADGTMLQWWTARITSGSMTAYGGIYIGTVLLNIPNAFVNTAYFVTGSSIWYNGANLALAMQEATSASQAKIRVWDVSSRTFTASQPLILNLFAVGRWK